ncbi:hypothetical protein F4809DRAFT_643372 [Biscogniauxia mediterranea]|nr:hypothetical protein F4809DRAFT_643372 [Biscogniauxia mediterranea]
MAKMKIRHVVCETNALVAMEMTRRIVYILHAHTTNRKLPIDQQWFSVWDIMFAGAERPVSPWVEGPIHEVLSHIREFWEEQGEEIITEHLQSRGQIPYDMPSEERNLEALHRTALRITTPKQLLVMMGPLKGTGSSSDNYGAEVLPRNFEKERPDARFGIFIYATNYPPFGDEGDVPVSFLDLDAPLDIMDYVRMDKEEDALDMISTTSKRVA